MLSELKRIKPIEARPLTLADLRAGERARIDCVVCEHATRCERLQAYGLTEGQIITLVQKSPAFVIRVDETELALDTEVARCVRLTPI